MNGRLAVDADLTFSDLYRFNRSLSLGLSIKRRIFFILSIALLSYAIWVWRHNVLLILVPGVLLTVIIFLSPYFAARMMVDWCPKMLGQAEYSFSEQNVTISRPMESVELLWEYFACIREAREFFLLYTPSTGGEAPRRIFVIPKRCFSSQEEITNLKLLLQRSYCGRLELRRT